LLLIAMGGSASLLLNTAFSVGGNVALPALLGWQQHKRANHLHREGIAQALRIHEADAVATMEYNRVSMAMASEQHKYSVLQNRITHEENMDLEKRIAIRENLRDEWTQLTERAGTVLIVNTLVLGVAFLMLIDGPLPPSVTLRQPILTVAYFCALSSAINLLLCSVRFTMILRFLAGKIIVSEMRDAINQSKRLDEQFRQIRMYKQYNSQPCIIKAACDDDDPNVRKKVEPITRRMTKNNKRSQLHESFDHCTSQHPELNSVDPDMRLYRVGADDDPAFVADMPDDRYAKLDWIKEEAGYRAMLPQHVAHLASLTSCRRRAKRDVSVDQNEGCNGISSSSSHDLPTSSPTVFGQMASFEEAPLCDDSANVAASPGAQVPAEEYDMADGDELLASEKSSIHGKIAEGEYIDFVKERTDADKKLQDHLQGLEKSFCRPWDVASQYLFFAGTVSLIIASCLLVILRWAFPNEPLPEGEVSFPSSRFASWGFFTPCLGTIVVLAYIEKQQPQNYVLSKKGIEQARTAEEATKSGSTDDFKVQGCSSQVIPKLTQGSFLALFCISIISFIVFVVLAAANPPSTFVLVATPSYSQEGNTSKGQAAPNPRLKSISLVGISLSLGSKWPSFWEPVAAAWWSARRTLVLVGALDVVQFHISQAHTGSAHISVLQRPTQTATLTGVCAVSGSLWIFPADDNLTIMSVDANSSSVPVLHAQPSWGCPSSSTLSRHGPLPCRIGCNRIGTKMQLWLSHNGARWPVVVGTEAAATSSNKSDGHRVSLSETWTLQHSPVRRWPVQWLNTKGNIAAGIAEALHGESDGATVESIAVRSNGDLLLLLTLRRAGKIDSLKTPVQLLAVVHANSGRLHDAVLLTPATSGAPTAAATLGVGRWVAIAIDEHQQRLFIVAGGPRPHVSVAALSAF
jgi:hypothetical protein